MARESKTKKEAPKRRRAAAKKNTMKIWIAAAVAVCIVIAVGACYFLIGRKDSSKTADGLCLGEMELGGLTLDEVKDKVKTLEGAFDDSEIVLSVEGKSEVKNIKASDISLEIDTLKTAEEAFNAGKNDKILKKGKIEAGYVFNYDAVKLTSIIDEFTADIGGDLKEHEAVVDGDSVIVKAGRAGKGISLENAEEVILKSFKPHAKTEAKVSMQDTEPKKMDADYLAEIIKADVKNAQYVYENGSVNVIDEVNGIELDKEDARAKLENFGAGSEDVRIKLIVTPAEITGQQLRAKLFTDVLGEYYSKYNAGNVNRTANVELAAKNINGKILMPGEVFSYNDTVGPRTAERGFRVASVYEANRVADGMGGGICQTTSTLYPAVLYADLEVIERTNHSLEVSYVPLGMDATVAWGSLDFKFRNSSDYPIKIQTVYGGGKVTVKIIGTKENKNKSIKVITERVSYTPFTVREIADDTLKPGEKISESNGFNGSVVNTYKVYYENGVEVKRESLGKSVYRMAEKVLRVGPPLEETENPEETTPEEGESGTEEIPVTTAPPTATPTPSASPSPSDENKPDNQKPITPEEIENEYPEGI